MDSRPTHIHIVAKANPSDHHVITTSTAPPAPTSLEDGHILARPLLLGLTSNNLSYALNGTRFNWWDAFPVPPPHDPSVYGIVPCWGYGEVLQSRGVPGLDAGRLLWGFWPSAQTTVDLALRATEGEVEGHFVEVSSARQRLWPLYRRYEVVNSGVSAAALRQDDEVVRRMALAANAKLTCAAGWLLNEAVFGAHPVHPWNDGEWSAEQGDLSQAVVVALAASGRTARGFADAVLRGRGAGMGPRAFLAVTARTNPALEGATAVPVKVVSYADMVVRETLDWIAGHGAKKIVVVDFGGRDNAFDELFHALEGAFAGKMEVMAIGVGGEARAPGTDDVDKMLRRMQLPNRFQMNATALQDAMMALVGEKEYFDARERAWEAFLARGCLGDLELEVGDGVADKHGFEKGWSDLCAGRLSGSRALAYRM